MKRANRVKSEIYAKMESFLQFVSPREQKILTLYYGLGGTESIGYKEIGLVFGVSAESIRKYERRAVQKMEENWQWMTEATQ